MKPRLGGWLEGTCHRCLCQHQNANFHQTTLLELLSALTYQMRMLDKLIF